MRSTFLLSTLFLVLSLTSGGCAAARIPNTDVEDTADNREVVDFVEHYRHALEERDIAALLTLVSPSYFDDNGTPLGTDDMDYGELREAVLHLRERVTAIRYEIRYRRVTFRDQRVFVDFTYTGNFRLNTSDGERWSRRLADNRIVLARQDGNFRIVSGL